MDGGIQRQSRARVRRSGSFSVGSWYRRREIGNHDLAEMCPTGHKRSQVSESFGSSSVASLRTPPTLVLARLRARLRDRNFTDSSSPPIRPPTQLFDRLPQRLPPKRCIADDFAGLVAACHRIVSQESVLRCWEKRHCAASFSLRVSF